DREGAESLRGGLIMITREERVELPEGCYWLDDLLGLVVVDVESGDPLGTLVEIMPTGSNDVYVVEAQDGKKRMLPAISEVIKEINLEEGLVKVHLMEGLWE
ncbi:MAG TPA: ribosome maturation factor RimM, partial [Acetomicrobium sp.]|nr:ribosome maturation factor RimM [Acetomicrobium sp.]